MDEDPGAAISRLLAANDIPGVVALIRAGAERGARLAALRPTWEQLGRQLFLFRMATHQVLLTEPPDTLTPFELRAPAVGSPHTRGAQDRATTALDHRHELLDRQVLNFAGVISDQLYGLAALMVAEPAVRPAFVIGRVLLEASATLHHLLDPDISPSDRAVRAANSRLSGLYDELHDHEDDPAQEAADRKRAEIEELLRQAEADGFALVRRRNGSRERFVEQRPLSSGAMAAELLGDLGPSAWRTLSSTVHAQDRPVLELATGRGIVSTSMQGRSVGALQLGPSVLMTTEAIKRATQFQGFESSVIAGFADELNLLWCAAAGMNDAEYAKRLD